MLFADRLSMNCESFSSQFFRFSMFALRIQKVREVDKKQRHVWMLDAQRRASHGQCFALVPLRQFEVSLVPVVIGEIVQALDKSHILVNVLWRYGVGFSRAGKILSRQLLAHQGRKAMHYGVMA